MHQNLIAFRKRLKNKIIQADNIYIAGHKRIDLDAFASLEGLNFWINKLGKSATFVCNEEIEQMESGTRKMVIETSLKPVLTPNLSLNENNLLIVVDTSKTYLIPCEQSFFQEVVTIDHHFFEESIQSFTDLYIDPYASSVSEIITELLTMEEKELPLTLRRHLLTGIYLDTNHLKRNTSLKTKSYIQKLMNNEITEASIASYFVMDPLELSNVEELKNKSFLHQQCIISTGIKTYSPEVIAKAADELLTRYCLASFVIGRLPNVTKISGRSNGTSLNVGEILSSFGNGGGNYVSGAAYVSLSPKECEQKLKRILSLKR